MQINDILFHLNGVKRLAGNAHYKALCPCHNDHEPSLDVLEKDGKLLMTCPVCGADGAAVMKVLGLPVRELFAEPQPSARPEKPQSVDYLYTEGLKKTRYYVWNAKKQCYQKSFCWYHLENGAWVKGKNGARAPLYKQDNIVWARERRREIYIAEGEKDVDTLTKRLHLPAVCSPHGAATAQRPERKWDSACNALFSGADVVILPDNDEAGHAFAHYVAEQLLPYAKRVRVPDLTDEWHDLPRKGDITDVCDRAVSADGSPTGCTDVCDRLAALISTTPSVTLDPERASNLGDEDDVPSRAKRGDSGDVWNGVTPDPVHASGHGDEADVPSRAKRDNRDDSSPCSARLYEEEYITGFVERHRVRCINGRLFSPDGVVDDGRVRQMIIDDILPCVRSNHGDKAEKLLRGIKALCYTEPPAPQTDRLHVANGTLFQDENGRFTRFSGEKEFCLNRIPVCYDPGAPRPERFLRYLREVFRDDDRETLQQYCGYCLLPTTVLQKALVIIGDGGEGKSVLGTILNGIFGESNCYNESVSVLQSPFGVANVEGKLLFIDDDLSESALKNARAFKNLVTNKTTIQAQKKFVQDNPIRPFVRFICFGNFTLQALYDLSEGFRRRQLILQVKPKAPGRTDDPFLDKEILENEAQGVLLWLLEGLNTLASNRFQIAVSDRTREQSDSLLLENDSVSLFLSECDGIQFGEGKRAHSATLFIAYEHFCRDNMLTPLRERGFLAALRAKGSRVGVEKLNSPFEVISKGGKKIARGFAGISVSDSYVNINY